MVPLCVCWADNGDEIQGKVVLSECMLQPQQDIRRAKSKQIKRWVELKS